MTKKCTSCEQVKSVEMFSKHSMGAMGVRAYCKECIAAQHAAKMTCKEYKEHRRLESKRYRLSNPTKVLEYSRKIYKKRKDTPKFKLEMRGHRLKKYWPGTTWQQAIEKYELLIKNQNYSCAICLKHQNHFTRSLAVDHSHKTHKVRGALCYRCNRLYVNIHTKETAKAVLEYLEKYDE